MPKNIILNSLKESFAAIWKNKSLFLLLLILQVAFFSAFLFLSQAYLIKILENAKAISDYMSRQKLDDVSVASGILQQKDILGDDPLSISRNFSEMAGNLRTYLIYVFILLAIMASINWTLPNKLIHKSGLRQLFKLFLKNLAVVSLYLAFIFSFFFSLFSISITEAAAQSSKLLAKYVPFLIFSIVLIYFMFVSLSLLSNTELKNIVQRTLAIGIKRMHYIFAAYSINMLLLAIPLILLYYLAENSFIVLLLSLSLAISSFVFGRIFMISVVKKLNAE